MKIEVKRVHSLDYLRGIMASGVMAYHFSYWTFGDFDSSTILGRLGIYGVSFFYILSGLTLFIVYNERPFGWSNLVKFLIKRFFRIYPLLWMVTILYIFFVGISDLDLIFLNLSGLFGFVKPEAAIGTGVWSIGNELVFYSLFPILLIAYKTSRILFYGLISVIFIVGLYFAFYILTPSSLLEAQWRNFVNPFNQFFLFAGGILIGFLLKNFSFRASNPSKRVLVMILVLLFCFYPVSGDAANLVTSWNRILFSLICFSICILVYSGGFELNGVTHKFFYFLGESCYSIYLLHPIAFKIVQVANNYTLKTTGMYLLPTSIVVTLIMSYISYNYLEKPLINFGGKILSKN